LPSKPHRDASRQPPDQSASSILITSSFCVPAGALLASPSSLHLQTASDSSRSPEGHAWEAPEAPMRNFKQMTEASGAYILMSQWKASVVTPPRPTGSREKT
jgi:hypothetical protein